MKGKVCARGTVKEGKGKDNEEKVCKGKCVQSGTVWKKKEKERKKIIRKGYGGEGVCKV